MRLTVIGAGAIASALLLFAAEIKPPAGLLPIVWPAENRYSPAKAELGRVLFFDKRLSADQTVSCATCHNPKFAFTDRQPTSVGIKGQRGNRNAPTVINRAYSLAQFWDGRAGTLEAQAIGPMANPIEMGHTHEAIVTSLNGIVGYKALFKAAFGDDAITIERAGQAIGTFERTVLSGNSPYDRWKAGSTGAMPQAAIRGYKIFQKANCDACHEGINFTSNMFMNIGVGMDKPNPDPGRFAVTKQDADFGAFKTPTLRDVALTAPYMHDGSIATLEEVVKFYDKGGVPNRNLDSKIKPLHLSPGEMADLVAFLKSLNGEGWQQIKQPDTFPQ